MIYIKYISHIRYIKTNNKLLKTMKRLLLTILSAAAFATTEAKDIVVTPGDYSIEKALQEARRARLLDSEKDITIKLTEGTYRLNQPIYVRPEDNGTKIIGTGKVVISGGVKISGWKRSGKMWVADVPRHNGRPLEFRQMWVNGKKAVRARDVDDFSKMYRIKNIDKPKEVLYVPAAAVKKIQKAKDAEMVLHEMWCVANLRIKEVKMMGGDSAAVYFHQPESHIHFMHPWPSPMITSDGHNSAFYITGSRELLDSEGEWWLDSKAEKVYYIPRKGEQMQTADVEVPAVETLVKVEGTPERLATDITFRGITFSHTTWMRPSYEGHAPLQAGMFMTEAFKLRPKLVRPNGDHKLDNQGWTGRPASAVYVNCAENVNFVNCTFEHVASTAIDYNKYIKGGKIEFCRIQDAGGNGIVAGTFGDYTHEAHLPYDPQDQREVCRGLNISNNTITDVTNEDWGCVGIAAGYVRDIVISHNEISEVSYTGISMGWGWNQQPCAMANNKVLNNLIHHYARHMYDTAGIYTLGAQPHSLIEGNVVRDIYTPSYAHDPNHWFYLYTDEGSSGIMVKNNWTPSEKFLKNANGPGNTWENNGPMVNDSIKQRAGIEWR